MLQKALQLCLSRSFFYNFDFFLLPSLFAPSFSQTFLLRHLCPKFASQFLLMLFFFDLTAWQKNMCEPWWMSQVIFWRFSGICVRFVYVCFARQCSLLFFLREAENKSVLIRECLATHWWHIFNKHIMFFVTNWNTYSTHTFTHYHALFKLPSVIDFWIIACQLYCINRVFVCFCVCVKWFLMGTEVKYPARFSGRWWWFEGPCRGRLDCICDLWAGRKLRGRAGEMTNGTKR